MERGRGCVTETILTQGAGLNVAPCRHRDTSIRRFCSVLERTSHQPPPPSPVRPPVNVTAGAETPGFLFSPPGCRPAAEPEAVVPEPWRQRSILPEGRGRTLQQEICATHRGRLGEWVAGGGCSRHVFPSTCWFFPCACLQYSLRQGHNSIRVCSRRRLQVVRF